ncbi:ORF201 [Staphylococcus phage EW]|uniref:ORF201 n=1 Tax=Staphylococcus phage EW TaxID=2936814 RepID=Q4ZC03_9CAUD|nr:ORF201 [Staphylococcus phage EW]AAX91416.1 ORF201 [Staphylococcus phage EW]
MSLAMCQSVETKGSGRQESSSKDILQIVKDILNKE